MALQQIQLDTLTWDQMVTAIRTRIVPDSQGQWTLHAPVDPGVTMLELFAWLLEQRVYWIAQIPVSLNLAILSLLGTLPQSAKPAVTLLQISDSAIPPRPFPVAAAGTLMQLGDTNPPIIFTLDDPLTVLPLVNISVSVNGVDHTSDLQQCRPVPLLSAGQSSCEVDVTLALRGKIPATAAGQFFSLMFELETPDAIYPQWSSNAVSNVPAPSTLTWNYTSTTNTASTAFQQVSDGTAGLRRSGVVRLSIPADWQPEPQGPDPNIDSYKIVLQIQNATFTWPPQLRRLKSNIVLARHLWSRAKNPLTSQWLPLPGNVILLPKAPSASSVQEAPPIEDSLQVQVKEADGVTRPWTRVSGLSLSGPTDRVFVVNRSASTISFGDGLTGRLPVTSPADASDVTVTYLAGGGIAGNVGQGLQWEAVPDTDAGAFPQFIATNLTPGDGGAESETIDAAVQRSTAFLYETNRAVSKADYENLARTTPGIDLRRAYAAVGYHPDFPGATVPGAITVFAVPYAPRVQKDGVWAKNAFVAAPVPDQGALQAAQARLSAAKLIGGEVFVCAPVYRRVWLTLTVAIDSPLSAAARQAVITGLQAFLDPLVGGHEGEGWAFGDPLRPSALLRVAQGILGTSGDVQSVAVRIDSASAAAEPCKDVTIHPHELVNLIHVDLVMKKRAVQSGGLR